MENREMNRLRALFVDPPLPEGLAPAQMAERLGTARPAIRLSRAKVISVAAAVALVLGASAAAVAGLRAREAAKLADEPAAAQPAARDAQPEEAVVYALENDPLPAQAGEQDAPQTDEQADDTAGANAQSGTAQTDAAVGSEEDAPSDKPGCLPGCTKGQCLPDCPNYDPTGAS